MFESVLGLNAENKDHTDRNYIYFVARNTRTKTNSHYFFPASIHGIISGLH